MTVPSRILLTPSVLGPAEWTDVALRLTESGHHVVVDNQLTYDRGIPAAAGSQLERLRDPSFWTSFDVDHVDLAVGLGVGAGPAASMVADGRATLAVLIDPDLTKWVMAHPDDIDVLVPEVDLELGLAISERLGGFESNLRNGPLTRQIVDIMCGTFTGEAWRVKQASLVAPFLMHSVTVDRSKLPTDADLQSSDWASSAAGEAVRIWLTAGRKPLANYLRDHGLNVTVIRGGKAPWIESVEELTAAIENQLDELHAAN